MSDRRPSMLRAVLSLIGNFCPPENQREVASEIIALCSAEYQVMMGRVTNWTVLQYALWPIAIGFYAIIEDHASDVPPAVLPWLLAAVLPISYLAYQSAMIDALNYILHVEGRLRPQAARIVGTQEFWTWESVHRRTASRIPHTGTDGLRCFHLFLWPWASSTLTAATINPGGLSLSVSLSRLFPPSRSTTSPAKAGASTD